MTMTADKVQETLNNIGFGEEFVVEFMKKDGTMRRMRCMMEKPEGEPKQSTAVPVMDLDIGQWRAFRLDSVVNISKAVGTK